MAGRRTLSLVDCVSFEVMRRTGIRKAFAFDRHFQDYGYEIYPSEE
jgi:predicted nucleic acid-binding protein